MKINETEFEYTIDYINKKVHLIEMSANTQDKSLANVLDPEFQKEMVKRESLLVDVLDFDWIVYMVNGMIANFKGYNFSVISPKLPFLHKPYLENLQAKRKGYGLN